MKSTKIIIVSQSINKKPTNQTVLRTQRQSKPQLGPEVPAGSRHIQAAADFLADDSAGTAQRCRLLSPPPLMLLTLLKAAACPLLHLWLPGCMAKTTYPFLLPLLFSRPTSLYRSWSSHWGTAAEVVNHSAARPVALWYVAVVGNSARGPFISSVGVCEADGKWSWVALVLNQAAVKESSEDGE